ncbi:DNA replication initiation factor cdc45 [Elasticomyces elasticus]|nr:DNA replication initiation factor cdc45 [Elasticomyces elasticus]
MYLPRALLSHLYTHLLRTTHPLSPPVLLLVSLDPDALCACRILTALLRRDYIPHKIQPVSGYGELAKAGKELVQPLSRQNGGDGGVVVCLGVGGLVDLAEVLGLDGGEDVEAEAAENAEHGVEVWVVDARRPWNLQNVFGSIDVIGGPADLEQQKNKKRVGVEQGQLTSAYRPGRGGIVVFDDGDIEAELVAEKEAFCALQNMPELDEQDNASDGDASDSGDEKSDSLDVRGKKRKSSSDREEDGSESDDEEERHRRRRRSNSVDLTQQPLARTLRRRLLRLRRKHENTLQAYYSIGTSYSEPISSMLYSLASELGREDNDLLWLSIVGVSSMELYSYSPSKSPDAHNGSTRTVTRTQQVHRVLQDEVRRLNPTPASGLLREREMTLSGGVIPTHARSPTDTSIRISPEPRFLLIRHWSLYDSMLHSPYLASRLHIWTDTGRRRLHKLLAKMGISLSQAAMGYSHMDVELKASLRQRLLKFAPMYGLEGLIPSEVGTTSDGWGFVRSWGWRACLSALDIAVIVSAILEVGTEQISGSLLNSVASGSSFSGPTGSYNTRMRTLPTPPMSASGDSDDTPEDPAATNSIADPDWTTTRFFAAYDALAPSSSSLPLLLSHIPTAQHLHRAILRTGSALIVKHQIRHLRAFRMAVVKEGPDMPLFCHPGALVKLAGWLGEAVAVLEAEKGRKEAGALVLGCVDEARGVYVVVGVGGGGGGAASATRVRSKAEQKAREEKKERKDAARAAKAVEKAQRRAEKSRLRRERNAANGLLSDGESDDESIATESASSSSSSDSDSDSDASTAVAAAARKRKGQGLNRFGAAFQEVVEETGARVRLDSFEHCVVEVRKEDLSGFLEALSLKTVVG